MVPHSYKNTDYGNLDKVFKILLSPSVSQKFRSTEETPYPLHLGYPSARSFYTIKIFVGISNRELVGLIPGTSNVGHYVSNSLEFEKYRIYIVKEREIALSTYSSIHNSLQVLESGHVLGCYNYISTLFDCSFVFKDYDDYNTVTFTNISKLANIYDKFGFVIDKFKHRSSGRYYGMLSNWNLNRNNYKFNEISNFDIARISKLTDENVQSVIPISYTNHKDSKNYLTDEFIQKEYPFLHPTFESVITVLALNLSVCNTHNLEIYLEKIGALAQTICMNNSSNHVVNRPVKQVIPKNWEKIDKFKRNKNLLPFYAVITTVV